ncbi:MAG: L,D-transpeptidase family protein [Hyphomicrobiales bacterium]
MKVTIDGIGRQRLSRRALTAGLAVAALAPFAQLARAESRGADETVTKKNFNVQSTVAPTDTEVIPADKVESPMLSARSEMMMKDAIARYRTIASQGGWQQLPRMRTLVLKSKGSGVAALRQRLAAEGFITKESAAGDYFDEGVQTAVQRFQQTNGIRPTGKVDDETQAALNIPVEKRIATLEANVPRVVEYAKNLGNRYIVVNVPATQLEAVENGSVRSRHNVIAGKIDRPTPVVESKIEEINFNPYWNAPVSIVEKDILPELRRGTAILTKLNIKVYDGYQGPEVDPKTIDWKTVAPDRYHFRQEPGEDNAMASVKINFKNPYNVYMHDTPTKQLFTQADRYFSSGCVRVDKIPILVNWILNGQDGWNDQRIADIAKSKERLDVQVAEGPQLRFAYLTAWATADGLVHFRDDVYNLDGTGFVTGQPGGDQAQPASAG